MGDTLGKYPVSGPSSRCGPRTLSLFSGIGGLDLGLERAGFQIVAQCEADPFCRAVLAKHWPGVPCFTDVRTINPAEVGDVECVCGGFPCQDVSVAGKGAGVEKGERSGLWREMLRIVDALRPRWVIAENVPALRTRGADRVLGDLEGLGYTCTPLVVGAEHVGAPHRRHRVFIVADSARRGLGTDGRARGHDRHADERGAVEHTDDAGLRAGGKSGTPRADGGGEAMVNADERGRRQYQPGRGPQGGTSARWPSPPGHPQHDWEAPRLVELPLGSAAHGISERLVRFGNRNALRAAGNAVVPAVAELIGRAVLGGAA